jgi:hypothetical protein
MKTGWYDNYEPRKSTTKVLYHNSVVNVVDDFQNPNNAELYTKENYIAALHSLREAGLLQDSFVQLPVFQVYNDQNGEEIELVDWWFVLYAEFWPFVLGFYIADEPEIWGTEYGPYNRKYPYEKVKSWKDLYYDTLDPSFQVPLLAVFCDVMLLEPKTDYWFDVCTIFGFDFYPLMTKEEIAKKGLSFKPGSKAEMDWIKQKFAAWIPILRQFSGREIMYVGQGCGIRAEDGSDNWGQRDFSATELNMVYQAYLEVMGQEPDYYVLWSWSRADNLTKIKCDVHLIQAEQIKVPKPKPKKGFFGKLWNFIKRVIS